MDEKEIKDIYNYYGLGKKHEKEEFKNYVLYFINSNIEVNNNYIEEIKKIDTIQAYIEKAEIEAKNETLKNIKDYILLYVDAENKNINIKEKKL